jgi:uncharacterized protein YegL
MAYTTLANGQQPAVVIYVLDISYSMTDPLAGRRRIDVVTDALEVALNQMVFRSMKGETISSRYLVGMIAYSDNVFDLLDGIKPVAEIANLGVPELSPDKRTDTARAFEQVEKILQAHIQEWQDYPAPLICHMTDGQYNGADPEPIARRIMNMRVRDGNVLLENIFISDQVLSEPIKDPMTWPGVTPSTKLALPYAQKLRAISSPLPESYRNELQKSGYRFAPDALMLLPGTNPEMVQLAFTMSTATAVSPVSRLSTPRSLIDP